MTRTVVHLALCLTVCQLAACAERFPASERALGPAARRPAAVPARLTSGGRNDPPASTLILGLN